jgi:hypothetical protein
MSLTTCQETAFLIHRTRLLPVRNLILKSGVEIMETRSNHPRDNFYGMITAGEDLEFGELQEVGPERRTAEAEATENRRLRGDHRN